MSTWEDLDDSSSDEDDEEANICLMENITFEMSKSYQEDEVNFHDPESLSKTYHERFYLTHQFSQKLTKTYEKDFKNLSKDDLKLEKTLQDGFIG